MKLIVFSICLNEEETIGKLIDQVPKKIPGISEVEVLVVSDGSSDDTVKIAKQHGAHVIDGKSQRRLAYRFTQSMDWLLTNGADIAVNIDGDLQFNPKDIPKLVKPIVDNEADFVAADRFTDPKTGERRRPKNMPVAKYWANRVGAWIVGRLSGQKFRDVTCGFRAYTREVMLSINLNSEYTYTQESFQLLASKKYTIKSLPTLVKYFPGRKSRVVTNFFQFMINSALNIMRAFRDFSPLKFFFWLGLGPFVFGFFSTGLVAINWITTGKTSPYTTLGIVGVYFVSLALIIWVVGLVADMQERSNKNQEKILEQIKHIRYNKTNGPKD